MVAKRKKKYVSGEGSRYMSRKAALKMLQLPLKDFRKLCILKGVYPREPRNRKRAQKGAKRYPSFIDAIRDLDDCLTLIFLFSTFPSLRHVPHSQSALCRRLSTEFLHAVIVSRALRKVFISIKGYYFQAEIKGQTVTWIVPHYFPFVDEDPAKLEEARKEAAKVKKSYVQPQWVFDSVNARELLPPQKYFLGADLPPHLSPFIDKTLDRYIPPEEKEFDDPSLANNNPVNDEDEDEEEEMKEEKQKVVEMDHEEEEEEEDEEEEDDDDEPENLRKKKKKAMSVSIGAVTREDPGEKRRQNYQEHKLREKMIKNKHRNLYRSMMKGRQKREKEAWLLGKKRKVIEAKEKAERIRKKKQNKLAMLGETSSK
ncbi:Pescadillo [Blattella germanica]|nr:Pescadillo [Blattella germanica]